VSHSAGAVAQEKFPSIYALAACLDFVQRQSLMDIDLSIGLLRRRARHKFIPDAFRHLMADLFAALALIFPMAGRKH
jgi:hypothetical protein